MSQLLDLLEQWRPLLARLHPLMAHPLVMVVIVALIVALIEQRLARRGTPDFSIAFRDVKGPPPKTPGPRPQP